MAFSPLCAAQGLSLPPTPVPVPCPSRRPCPPGHQAPTPHVGHCPALGSGLFSSCLFALPPCPNSVSWKPECPHGPFPGATSPLHSPAAVHMGCHVHWHWGKLVPDFWVDFLAYKSPVWLTVAGNSVEMRWCMCIWRGSSVAAHQDDENAPLSRSPNREGAGETQGMPTSLSLP